MVLLAFTVLLAAAVLAVLAAALRQEAPLLVEMEDISLMLVLPQQQILVVGAAVVALTTALAETVAQVFAVYGGLNKEKKCNTHSSKIMLLKMLSRQIPNGRLQLPLIGSML
jgi:Ca2+/Na+ antiporter